MQEVNTSIRCIIDNHINKINIQNDKYIKCTYLAFVSPFEGESKDQTY